jgi:hypothetical protein
MLRELTLWKCRTEIRNATFCEEIEGRIGLFVEDCNGCNGYRDTFFRFGVY